MLSKCCCADAKEAVVDVESMAAVDPVVFCTVQVLGVRGTSDSDWPQGTGNPECAVVIMHGGTCIGSAAVVADSPRPMWTDEFEVTNAMEGDELEFRVHAKDGGTKCLGRIAMKHGQFAANGFNDEVLLEDTGANIKAYLSLKIKPLGKQYPADPATTFTVEVEKGQNAAYGLVLDGSDDAYILVCEIEAGAVADYNKSVEPSQQLKKSDLIVSVNEQSGYAGFVNEFHKSKVTCVVKRNIEFSLTLERENLQKPLGLRFAEHVREQGYGLPIISVSVTEGAAKEDNTCAGEWDKLQAHDRIVSVNGERGQPPDLKAKMENTTGEFQVGILRMCSEKISDRLLGA
jgi:hypothetical protein